MTKVLHQFQLTMEKNLDTSTEARTRASWVTSLKRPGQKGHGGILTGLGSEVKVALISLERNSKRNIFQGSGNFCVCWNMEMTSQGDNREIKDSLLTKMYKTSKEKATTCQRKTVAQTRLRSHHYYGFDI